MSLDLREIKKGKYRHYKGSVYQVMGTAYHSETEELLVLYQPLSADSALWVRPYNMFIESVVFDGKSMPRFELIE